MNGKYSADKKLLKVKVKYDKEFRMSLSCAIIHKTDANDETNEEGKRCMPYEYSGKAILSVIGYLEKMNK